MNLKRALLLLLVALFAGLIVGRYRAHRAPRPVAPPPSAPSAEHPRPAAATPAPAPVHADPVPAPATSLLSRIERLLTLLQSGANPAELAALKRELLASDPDASIAAIISFLASGRDASTSLDFQLGERGALDAAPTLRTMLLDVLGQIARTSRSDAAAKYARTLLESKTSADEWALALRNVAWHDPTATPYLAGKMRELLAHAPWRERPSAGMLEAFDVIVFAKDASFIPDLADAQRAGQRDLSHAAAIALDRLAEQTPLDVMNYLNTHPTTLATSPMLRADYYAKADVSQPAQRAALEVYLGRPDIAPAEKEKLLKAIATPASFVSENLLTESAPPPADDGAAARRDALGKVASDWLTTNRFPDLTAPLTLLQQRLK